VKRIEIGDNLVLVIMILAAVFTIHSCNSCYVDHFKNERFQKIDCLCDPQIITYRETSDGPLKFAVTWQNCITGEWLRRVFDAAEQAYRFRDTVSCITDKGATITTPKGQP